MTDLEFTVVDNIRFGMDDLTFTFKFPPVYVPDNLFDRYRNLLVEWVQEYRDGQKETTPDDYSKFLDKVKELSTELRHFLQRKLNHHVI